MSVTIIPNQPINLSYVDRDSCLPTDNKRYCSNYDYGDYIYCQIKSQTGSQANCNPNFIFDGSELLTNNTFATDLSGWTTGAGTWTWSTGGGAHVVRNGTTTLTQTGITITPTSYRYVCKMVITNFVGGKTFNVYLTTDSTNSATVTVTGNGTYYFFVYASTSPIDATFTMSSNTAGGIDCVIYSASITEDTLCIGGGTNWQFTDGAATHMTGNTDLINLPVNTPIDSISGRYVVYVSVTNITAGSLAVINGATLIGTITEPGEYQYYANFNNGDLITLLPTSDCPCSVTYFDAYEIPTNNDIVITDVNGTTFLDLVTNGSVTYEKDRITIKVRCGDLTDQIPNGCYLLKFTNNFPFPTTYTSNRICVDDAQDCGKLIEAYGDTDFSRGFYWAGGFRLSHRIRFLKFNPEYPIDSDDYEDSSGSRNYTYTKREKFYTGKIDYVDETAHDTISTQITCEVLRIDNVQYFVKPNAYKPNWSKEGEYELAQANIELRKLTGTIYSTNQ